MRRFTFFLTLLLILTACAAPSQPTVVPTEAVATEPQTETRDATFETSLLAVEWKNSLDRNVLFPVDPTRGTILPGYEPIPLGESFFHAFSPDRHTLAVMSFSDPNAYDGSLLLIDLLAWKTQRFELELIGWVSNMVFSPDGKRLAIAHGLTNYKLTIVDTERGAITEQIQMDSIATRLKFTESGEALMLYRPSIDHANGWSGGPPQVQLLDAAELGPLWSTTLEDIHDGIFPKDENTTVATMHEPGQAFYISPGLTFAPDQDILYVVHADSEQLTTVDFAAQTVKTVDIQPALTWFERLLSFTAGVAHAKIGDGVVRQAAISPEGRYLYVVGVNHTTIQDKYGVWRTEQTPHGLEIIQTKDGKRIEHIETDTTELSISPDGRLVYLRGWGNNEDNLPWTEIFDTASQQLVTRKDNLSAMPALLINGEFLLVSTFSTSEYSHHISILPPDGSRVLSDWTSTHYISWITVP